MDCVDKITITNFEGVYEPAEDSWLMVNHLPEIKGSVLEIGCGAGIISVHLASKGAQVTAVQGTLWCNYFQSHQQLCGAW